MVIIKSHVVNLFLTPSFTCIMMLTLSELMTRNTCLLYTKNIVNEVFTIYLCSETQLDGCVKYKKSLNI